MDRTLNPRKDESSPSRMVTRLRAPAAALAFLFGLYARAASACPTLTAANMEHYLAQGEMAFVHDLGSQAATPGYRVMSAACAP